MPPGPGSLTFQEDIARPRGCEDDDGLKDIDFASNQIVVRAGKGERDRVQSERRRGEPESPSARPVTLSVTRSPLTCSRTGTTSPRSKSCSGPGMSAPPWSTRTCWTVGRGRSTARPIGWPGC